MRGISKADWNMLMRDIHAVKTTYQDVSYIQIRDNVFIELEFDKSSNSFGMDILEGIYYDHGMSTGNSVLGYSNHYTPNLIPTVIKLAKEYIGTKDFQEILKNEYKTNKGFSSYFSSKTGIDYHDLVIY